MELIDKSALIAKIEERMERNNKSTTWVANAAFYEDGFIIDIINTIEVKDIDFNEEHIEEIQSHIDGIRDKVDRMTSGNFMHSKAAIKFSANTIEKVLLLMGIIKKGE